MAAARGGRARLGRDRGFFSLSGITPAAARYLTEVDHVDHFASVAIDGEDLGVGGASDIRSRSSSRDEDLVGC